jgi:NAD(P)-dependent dehydrogenase (short-subunit alcohol dehydrogenase family)
MTKKLSGKVALVTGGSRGIGAARARACTVLNVDGGFGA